MKSTIPEWSEGFVGYIANLNKTVIKIFGNNYLDEKGEGSYMMGIWPYGSDVSGDRSKNRLLNNKYEEPIATYYLVRKDVADGLDLELQDTEEKSSATLIKERKLISSHPKCHYEAYSRRLK